MAKTHDTDLGEFSPLPRSADFAGTGVYLLHRQGKVVYVGQARDMRKRIGDHFGEGFKDFDGVSCIPCALERLDRVEALMIERLAPEYNRCSIANAARKLSDWREDDTLPDMHLGVAQAAGILGITAKELLELGDDGPRFTIKRMPRTRSRRRSYSVNDLLEFKQQHA